MTLDWPTDARACLERVRDYIVALRDGGDGVVFPEDVDALAADVEMTLEDKSDLEPNATPLGRLRLELKALGDAATMNAMEAHNEDCRKQEKRYAGRAEAYYHALDLVMALEREQGVNG